MMLLGLAGGAGVGKTYLHTQFLRPWGYFDAPLADELKVRCVARGVASFDDAFFNKPPAVRKWLQEEGTERGRDLYGEDIWCTTLLARLRRVEQSWGIDRFVVSDVRFPNEVEFILQHGGIVLRVEAPDRYASNGLSDDARQHRSERALDDFPRERYSGILRNDPEYALTIESQLRKQLNRHGFPTAAPALMTASAEAFRQLVP